MITNKLGSNSTKQGVEFLEDKLQEVQLEVVDNK
jgi:hypothetical protein